MSWTLPVLTIEAADEPDAYVIRVEGEVDRAGMPDLESVPAAAERSQCGQIVVDLDGLKSIDARGTGEVSRMFRLTMLDLTPPFTDPVDAQASAVTPERVGS